LTSLLVGFGCGLGLGGLYFAMLWATVRRVTTFQRPGALVLVSYLGRLAIVGTGFYGTIRIGGASAALSALVGFLTVRHVMLGRVRRSMTDRGRPS